MRSKYSERCQTVFRDAWNSTYEKTHSEERAFQNAHTAAKNCEEHTKAMDTEVRKYLPATKFTFYTPEALKSANVDGKRYLRGIASSTVRDRHGDVMTLSALQDMERSASQNLTIFLNHSYEVPEDVGGSVKKAELKMAGREKDGEPMWDLMFLIAVNDTNPRAVQTADAIDAGIDLGLSIGAMIPDGGAYADKNGHYVIEHVELLETSLVGVPANPRSWVEYAVKALRKSATIEPDIEESHSELPDSAFACISPGGSKDSSGKTTPRSLRHYPHHTASGALDQNLLRNALARIANEGNEQCGKAHLEAHAGKEGIGDRGKKEYDDIIALHALLDVGIGPEEVAVLDAAGAFSHEHEHAHSHAHGHSHDDGEMDHEHDHSHLHEHPHAHGAGEDHEHDEAMNHPDHNHDHNGSDGEHPHGEKPGDSADDQEPDEDQDDQKRKDIEPELQEATVTITTPSTTVQIDDEGTAAAQETHESAPENAGLLDETADGDDARLGDDVTRSVPQLLRVLNSAAGELVETKKALGDALAARMVAETERDKAIAERDLVLTTTKRLLDQLADTPLGRRATFVETRSSFQRFRGMYDEDYIKMLEKTNE